MAESDKYLGDRFREFNRIRRATAPGSVVGQPIKKGPGFVQSQLGARASVNQPQTPAHLAENPFLQKQGSKSFDQRRIERRLGKQGISTEQAAMDYEKSRMGMIEALDKPQMDAMATDRALRASDADYRLKEERLLGTQRLEEERNRTAAERQKFTDYKTKIEMEASGRRTAEAIRKEREALEKARSPSEKAPSAKDQLNEKLIMTKDFVAQNLNPNSILASDPSKIEEIVNRNPDKPELASAEIKIAEIAAVQRALGSKNLSPEDKVAYLQSLPNAPIVTSIVNVAPPKEKPKMEEVVDVKKTLDSARDFLIKERATAIREANALRTKPSEFFSKVNSEQPQASGAKDAKPGPPRFDKREVARTEDVDGDTYEYDSQGRKIADIDRESDGRESRTEYDENGLPTKFISSNGSYADISVEGSEIIGQYDKEGKILAGRSRDKYATPTNKAKMAKVEIGPSGSKIEYDSQGRKIAETKNGNRTEYDINGDRTLQVGAAAVDRNGRSIDVDVIEFAPGGWSVAAGYKNGYLVYGKPRSAQPVGQKKESDSDRALRYYKSVVDAKSPEERRLIAEKLGINQETWAALTEYLRNNGQIP